MFEKAVRWLPQLGRGTAEPPRASGSAGHGGCLPERTRAVPHTVSGMLAAREGAGPRNPKRSQKMFLMPGPVGTIYSSPGDVSGFAFISPPTKAGRQGRGSGDGAGGDSHGGWVTEERNKGERPGVRDGRQWASPNPGPDVALCPC